MLHYQGEEDGLLLYPSPLKADNSIQSRVIQKKSWMVLKQSVKMFSHVWSLDLSSFNVTTTLSKKANKEGGSHLGSPKLSLLKLSFQLLLSSIVKTQRNSTQLNATLKQLALELDIVVKCTPPPHPTTNFPATSRPARELKFGTDTHQTNLIKKTQF